MVHKNKKELIDQAVENLQDALNDISFGADEASEILLISIENTHRTLQQETIGTLINTIIKYADTKWFDLRNEASVKLCQTIRDLLIREGLIYDGKIRLPFI